jgi:cellulose synthase/poly-beta-1,6-N-acetylglucosamine synthase-like glycosyltransferase
MAKKKSATKHGKKYQPKKYTPPAPPSQTTEEADREFIEKYGDRGIVRTTLRVWKDVSPLTFITYFPVIVLYIIYCVLWFLINIFVFIPSTVEFGFAGRDVLQFCSLCAAAVGVPLLETVLHTVYCIKNKKRYFFNTVLYTLPASLLYIALDLINVVIAFMLIEGGGVLISDKLVTVLYELCAAVGVVFLGGGAAQVILTIKFPKAHPFKPEIPKKK